VACPVGGTLTSVETSQLTQFLSQGGHVLLLHPGKLLPTLFPDQVKSYQAKEGEIVTMHIPESPVFSGMEPLDISWFDRGGRQLPIACTGVYQLARRTEVVGLADQCDLNGYLGDLSNITKISGTPLVEIHYGKGLLLSSELNLESGLVDPISKRLLTNFIQYLLPKHS